MYKVHLDLFHDQIITMLNSAHLTDELKTR